MTGRRKSCFSLPLGTNIGPSLDILVPRRKVNWPGNAHGNSLLSSSYHQLRFVYFMCAFCLCVFMGTRCVSGAYTGRKRTVRSTRTGVTGSSKPSYGYWEPNPGSLPEWPVFLTKKSTVWPT